MKKYDKCNECEISFAIELPNQLEIVRLIEDLDAFQVPLYPVDSNHCMSISELEKTNVLFAVARNKYNKAIACGAIVLNKDYGELKRFYTDPEQRGKGIARKLINFLEQQAQSKGYYNFFLETGNLQPEAISLYLSCGYEFCEPFGTYIYDPCSVFMCKYT